MLVKMLPELARKETAAREEPVLVVQLEPEMIALVGACMEPQGALEPHVVVEGQGIEPAHTKEVASSPELLGTSNLAKRKHMLIEYDVP